MLVAGAVSDMLLTSKGPHQGGAAWLCSGSNASGSPCRWHFAAVVLAGKLHAVPLNPDV